MICISIVLTGRLSILLLECSASYLQYNHLACSKVVRVGHINSEKDAGPRDLANKILFRCSQDAWQASQDPTIKTNIDGMERWMLDINEKDSQFLRTSKGSSLSNVVVVPNKSVENALELRAVSG